MRRLLSLAMFLSILLAACATAPAAQPAADTAPPAGTGAAAKPAVAQSSPIEVTVAPASTETTAPQDTATVAPQDTATAAPTIKPTAETVAVNPAWATTNEAQMAILNEGPKLSIQEFEQKIPSIDASSPESMQAGLRAWDASLGAPVTDPKITGPVKWHFREGSIWSGKGACVTGEINSDKLKAFPGKPGVMGFLRNGPGVVEGDASTQLIVYPEVVNGERVFVITTGWAFVPDDNQHFDATRLMKGSIQPGAASWAVPFIRIDDRKDLGLAQMQDMMKQLKDAGLMNQADNDAFFQAIKDGKPAPKTDRPIVVVGIVASEQSFLKQH